MADNAAKVTLSLVDLTQGRIASLRQDLEQLAKLRGQTAASPADRAMAANIKAQADGLKEVERGARGAQSGLTSLKSAMGGLGSIGGGSGGAARAGFGGFLGGAGMGPIGGLIGALSTGSITGMAAAVGAIIGQATKMAYDFERTSVRASQALGIGTSANLGSSVASLKAAAQGGGAYNMSAPEMLKALTSFGSASGSTVQQTIGARNSIGLYSKAYGLDATQLATQIGGIVAMSGGSAKSEMGGVFGAAEGAGALGRRINEFIGISTSTLAALQATDTSRKYSGGEAAGYVANISSAGGYFGTAAGVNNVMAGGRALTSGATGSLAKLALMASSGMSNNEDLILGRTDPQKQGEVLKRIINTTSGGLYDSDKGGISGQLASRLTGPLGGMSGEQAMATIDLLRKRTSGARGQAASDAAVDSIFGKNGSGMGKGAPGVLSPADEEKKAIKALSEYATTTLGKDEKLFADLTNKELEVGQHVLDTLSKSAGAIDKLLNGDIKGGIQELISSNGMLIAALTVAAIASAGGGGALAGLFKGAGAIGRGAFGMLAGAGESAALGGEILGGASGTALKVAGAGLRLAGPLAAVAAAYGMYTQNSHGASGSAGEEPLNGKITYNSDLIRDDVTHMVPAEKFGLNSIAKYSPVITSGMHGLHIKGSAHYAGRAADVGAFEGINVGDNYETRKMLERIIRARSFSKIGTYYKIVREKHFQELARANNVSLFEDNNEGTDQQQHMHLQVAEGYVSPGMIERGRPKISSSSVKVHGGEYHAHVVLTPKKKAPVTGSRIADNRKSGF